MVDSQGESSSAELATTIGTTGFSRRRFLSAVGAGAGLAALTVAGCGSDEAPSVAPAATAGTENGASNGRPAGMGGPYGWEGAERYQYGPDSAPGRAIEAARRLKAEGKAPATLVVGMYAGAIGSYEQAFPGEQSPMQIWEEETGIPVQFEGVDPAEAYAQATRFAATRDGSQHIVQLGMSDNGDLAEAGLLLDLSEFVEQYEPDWDDPVTGYAGGRPTTEYMNYYNGKPYAVSQDGDYQVLYLREDLFNDAAEQREFESRFGRSLEPPNTWEEYGEIAEFFHRPDQGMFGSTSLRSPVWGWINYFMRYVSTGDPVQFTFDDDMNPLIDSDEGLRALRSYIDDMAFGSPDALSWTWEQQYGNWGNDGGSAMTVGFNNLRKFIRGDSPLNTGGFGEKTMPWYIPGFEVNGTLSRHTSLYFNASNAVNAHSDSEHHELAYVFLQWLSSGQVYNWINANPGGFQDPCKANAADDPLIRESYSPETMDVLKVTVPGAVPSPSSLEAAPAYIQALDINLQRALSNQASPEQALAAIVSDWDTITERVGRDKQVEAWRASKAGWPTVADSVTA
jgi:multiple sugar transport system substrate-binding protein